MNDLSDIAMQTYCVHCGMEQYAPLVYPISLGEVGCAWCGKKSCCMTDDVYKLNMRSRDESGEAEKDT